MQSGTDYQKELIDLLSMHELKLAELYENYAGRFQDDSIFWHHMAKEERYHSDWILALHRAATGGKIQFRSDEFSTFDVQSSINNINGLIVAGESVPISLKKAFETAYRYEKSLIENGFFKMFKGDSQVSLEVINRLEIATIKHSEELEQKMKQLDLTSF